MAVRATQVGVGRGPTARRPRMVGGGEVASSRGRACGAGWVSRGADHRKGRAAAGGAGAVGLRTAERSHRHTRAHRHRLQLRASSGGGEALGWEKPYVRPRLPVCVWRGAVADVPSGLVDPPPLCSTACPSRLASLLCRQIDHQGLSEHASSLALCAEALKTAAAACAPRPYVC